MNALLTYTCVWLFTDQVQRCDCFFFFGFLIRHSEKHFLQLWDSTLSLLQLEMAYLYTYACMFGFNSLSILRIIQVEVTNQIRRDIGLLF